MGQMFARALWNACFDKKPKAICMVRNEEEVSAAIQYASKNNLELAVKSGGHSQSGRSTTDGGLMINLSKMNAITVDKASKTAVVQAGALWDAVDQETHKHGLATVGGTVNITGVAGFTLGGGFGFLSRQYGMACDNVLSARMVLADGSVVTVSKDENPDLFWGIRGGGGRLGIVTEFTFQCYDVDHIYGGLYVFPGPMLEEVMQECSKVNQNLDHRAECWPIIAAPPPEFQTAIIMNVFFNGPKEEGEKLFAGFKALGPVADMVSWRDYPSMNALHLPNTTPGHRYYMKSRFLKELTPSVWKKLVEDIEEVKPMAAFIENHSLSPEYMKVENAFTNRDVGWNLMLLGHWVDPAMDDGVISGMRSIFQKFQDSGVFTNVNYSNYNGVDDNKNCSEEDVSYGAAKGRLAELKKKYDPKNVFALNQ